MSFLGYSSIHKGYKCLDLNTNRLYSSRDVIFHEETFPYSTHQPVTVRHSNLDHTQNTSHVQLPVLNPLSSILGLDPGPGPGPNPLPFSSQNPSPASFPVPIFSPQSQTPSFLSPATSAPLILTPPRSPIITRAHTNSSRPHIRMDGTVTYPSRKCLATTVTPPETPSSYSAASKHSEWHDAMNQEYQTLLQNHTWTLVPPNLSSNVLGCRWVYRTKAIERRKARLVAKGYQQQPGLDFHETFSPVIKAPTIRLILSLVVASGWLLRQIDI